jgi:hypothetical protein
MFGRSVMGSNFPPIRLMRGKDRIFMRVFIGLLLIIFVGTLCVGCKEKYALEGKLVDGKKQPLPGMKVVARMVLPIKGYELFEAATDASGAFRFKKLFPASEYELTVYNDTNTKSMTVKTRSGPKGKTVILAEPITIRFIVAKDGVTVSDTRTGLMWTRDADILRKMVNLDQATSWVNELDIGGHRDWRLPRRDELLDLTISCGGRPAECLNGGPFINVEPSFYWSTTTHENNPDHAWWVTNMNSGGEINMNKAENSYAWPVRVER